MDALATTVKKSKTPFKTKALPANKQRSLAGRYALSVQVMSLAAFSLAFMGWINEGLLHLWDNPIWLNRYTEYAIILVFGLWRIRAEHNPYTRKRLIVLVSVVTMIWWLVPWLFPVLEPHFGDLGSELVFPSLHTPGTITFFLVLAAVALFGRRFICGWGCPCVGIRETVGFAFRHVTPRGRLAWALRHSKWIFFALYVVVFVLLFFPLNPLTAKYFSFFALLVGLTYFGSMLLSPVIGNRGYCRYLCPFGATFGLLNKAGLYRIDFDAVTCNDCGVCTQVCDMGIPVLELARQKGKIDVADCMGCGRCVTECTKNSLVFHDVRSVLRPSFAPSYASLRAWATGKTHAIQWQACIFAALLLMTVAGASWLAP